MGPSVGHCSSAPQSGTHSVRHMSKITGPVGSSPPAAGATGQAQGQTQTGHAANNSLTPTCIKLCSEKLRYIWFSGEATSYKPEDT